MMIRDSVLLFGPPCRSSLITTATTMPPAYIHACRQTVERLVIF